MKVSNEVKVSGMSRKWVSETFDTTMTLRVNGNGSTYAVRGRGWSFTFRFGRGGVDVEIVSIKGLEADIDHTLTLARLAI
jgi:hypothetical protein